MQVISGKVLKTYNKFIGKIITKDNKKRGNERFYTREIIESLKKAEQEIENGEGITFDSKEYKIYYKLFNEIIKKLKQLQDMPQIYAMTEKCDKLGRRYRKIIIKQYVILYTIDEQKKQIYISHIFYKKSNYFSKL